MLKPVHIISTGLFGIALVMSFIGPHTEGTVQMTLWLSTILLLVVGWAIHIFGVIKK